MPDGSPVSARIVTNEQAQASAKELLFLLSALSTTRFFQPSNQQSWYTSFGTNENPKNELQVEWGQEFYTVEDINHEEPAEFTTEETLINRAVPQEYYNRLGRMMGANFELPENIEEMLDAYFSLDKESRVAFLSSAALFYQGLKLWNEFPSLSFAAFVSAIETLVTQDHKGQAVEKCGECNQDRFRVTAKFQDFFTKYGSPTPQFRKYAQRVYLYRSRILHSGKLFLGELAPRQWASFSGNDDDEFRRSVIASSRISMVNWLLSNNTQEPE